MQKVWSVRHVKLNLSPSPSLLANNFIQCPHISLPLQICVWPGTLPLYAPRTANPAVPVTSGSLAPPLGSTASAYEGGSAAWRQVMGTATGTGTGPTDAWAVPGTGVPVWVCECILGVHVRCVLGVDVHPACVHCTYGGGVGCIAYVHMYVLFVCNRWVCVYHLCVHTVGGVHADDDPHYVCTRAICVCSLCVFTLCLDICILCMSCVSAHSAWAWMECVCVLCSWDLCIACVCTVRVDLHCVRTVCVCVCVCTGLVCALCVMCLCACTLGVCVHSICMCL